MPDAIRFTDVSKSYRNVKVLSDISFRVNEGECVGLVGINGAGKTTAIKCLLDFCDIDSGLIRLFDVDHRQIHARKRLMYLPEKFTPPYYLTGRDFLQYMGALNSIDYSEEETIRILGVLDLDIQALDKPVRDLSKGMGQKLGLAASLLSEKDMLIFDEPMSGLDPRARARLKQHLLQIKEQGITLFYSTHLLEDVEVLCDRVIILHNGRICFSGTTRECCERYAARDFESAYLNCVAD